MSALDAKILAARAVGQLARRAGRGGGTSLPGKVLTRLEPRAIERLAARLPQGCAIISATNGKTTTAAMAASVLERAGIELVHNRAGANMAGGVARVPSCSLTCSAISWIATESWTRSPIAGPPRSPRCPQTPCWRSTPTIR
jgi:UDP-N-acetylmuramyl tripeptide synthase